MGVAISEKWWFGLTHAMRHHSGMTVAENNLCGESEYKWFFRKALHLVPALENGR
jgi:hypothetical protein